MLAGIAAGIGIGNARRARLRAVCWLPTLTALAVVLSGDVFEFSWRYQLPLLVLAPVAGVLGATAIVRDPTRRYPAAPGSSGETDEACAARGSGSAQPPS